MERLQQEQLFGALSGAGVNDDTLHAVRGNEDFMRASLYNQRKLDGEGGKGCQGLFIHVLVGSVSPRKLECWTVGGAATGGGGGWGIAVRQWVKCG